MQMVDLLSAYSNHLELLEELVTLQRRLSVTANKPANERYSVCSEAGQPSRPWRVTDRLTAQELDGLIDCYRMGTTSRELAQRYSLSRTTVKRLMRVRGIRRRKDQSNTA